jgi:4-amino-4-deoxy-L-arabinose transferase-like glycosyltransferase
MATVASARERLVPRLVSLSSSTLAIVAFVLGLTLVSLGLRTLALGDSLWMDEGLSIGLASQPLFDIPGDLRQDGNPPLYYMLLNVWMGVFGDGPGETQGLSVAISLLAIPIGLWAGWSLFGRRAGLIGASLGALNPFLTTYAQETRMYSLMVVLSLALTATFVHVYVYRNRRYLPAFGVVLALMLYTHSWGLFVTFGALVAFGVSYLEAPDDDRRQMVRDGLLGFGVALLLFLPWIPTLLYQVGHTGAPWVNPPRFGVIVQLSKSILGGGTVTVALVLAAGFGLAAVWTRALPRDRGGEDDPQARRERNAAIAIVAFGAATLAVAWLVSQVSPAWTTRYLGISLGPLIMLASLGLARAGNLGLAALAIVLVIWAIPHTNNLENKSNAADLGKEAPQLLRPGDLVVVLQPEQAPLVEYEVPVEGLTWATQLGKVENPEVMDWRNGMDRMEDATPEKNLEPLLATLPDSARVLLVHPITTQRDQWDAPWTELVRRRSAQWGRAMEDNAGFTHCFPSVPHLYRRATRIGIRGVLYEKGETCTT